MRYAHSLYATPKRGSGLSTGAPHAGTRSLSTGAPRARWLSSNYLSGGAAILQRFSGNLKDVSNATSTYQNWLTRGKTVTSIEYIPRVVHLLVPFNKHINYDNAPVSFPLPPHFHFGFNQTGTKRESSSSARSYMDLALETRRRVCSL